MVWLENHLQVSKRRKAGGLHVAVLLAAWVWPGASTHLPASSLPASENDLLNKRLKLDYEEITPCLKEVTTVWEKMLSTPGRSKIKFDMERMHAAVGQGECGFLWRREGEWGHLRASFMWQSGRHPCSLCFQMSDWLMWVPPPFMILITIMRMPGKPGTSMLTGKPKA